MAFESAAHLHGVNTSTPARRPAGSPTGGQFVSTGRAESDLDLDASAPPPSSIPHSVAWMGAGDAGSGDLLSVVRAGLPDHEDGLPAVLTREQVRAVLTRHLPGLCREELAAHLDEIERASARWDQMEAADPDNLDPGFLDPDTAHPISLDRVREDYSDRVRRCGRVA